MTFAFFGQEEGADDPQDTLWADQLMEFLKAHRRLLAAASRNRWALEFGKLRRQTSPERITKALGWYVQQPWTQYHPQARSAQAFRKKFLQIETAMTRTHHGVEPSPRAKQITQRLLMAHWPLSQEQLEQSVEQSLINLKTLCIRLKELELPTALRSYAKRFVAEIQDGASFVEQWYALHQRRIEWRGSADCAWLVVALGSKQFDSWAFNLSIEHSGNTKRWSALRRLLE